MSDLRNGGLASITIAGFNRDWVYTSKAAARPPHSKLGA